MKRPYKALADLRMSVCYSIEELGAVLTHLREAFNDFETNPKGAAMSLADAGTVLMELHDTFGNLSKASFDLKGALEK